VRFAERPEDSQLLVARGRTTPVAVRTRTATGRPRRRVLQSKECEGHLRNGSGTSCGAESQQQKQGAKKLHKTRWFRAGQCWRTGCVGHISVLKRRQGLNRCRYRGFEGMRRWVGPGVIADNIIQLGRSCPCNELELLTGTTRHADGSSRRNRNVQAKSGGLTIRIAHSKRAILRRKVAG